MNIHNYINDYHSRKQKYETKLFNTKLEDLGISIRLSNCFHSGGIVYVGDLIQKSEKDLLKIINFGHSSLGETHKLMTQIGLELAGTA